MGNLNYKEGSNLKRAIAIIAIVLVVSYGIWNARNIIFGPSIEIWSPLVSETTENLLVIKGQAKNIAYLSINERPIYIDTEGRFEDRLLLAPGFNIIRLYGRDRFKQETTEEFKIYYKENKE